MFSGSRIQTPSARQSSHVVLPVSCSAYEDLRGGCASNGANLTRACIVGPYTADWEYFAGRIKQVPSSPEWKPFALAR